MLDVAGCSRGDANAASKKTVEGRRQQTDNATLGVVEIS